LVINIYLHVELLVLEQQMNAFFCIVHKCVFSSERFDVNYCYNIFVIFLEISDCVSLTTAIDLYMLVRRSVCLIGEFAAVLLRYIYRAVLNAVFLSSLLRSMHKILK